MEIRQTRYQRKVLIDRPDDPLECSFAHSVANRGSEVARDISLRHDEHIYQQISAMASRNRGLGNCAGFATCLLTLLP